ncbi:MAG TPA: DegT/DnrJ/EryC1/StrS family aminotransferase [Deltaproteobacteria bacterium]|nr:DegT/DnrJ/EryC1/StrS family aminotransferase [Deltaproteobacteria bacterium]
MNDFIPMSRPYFDEEEVEAVAAVLRSGWITTGPKCKEFEEGFASFIGARQALSLNSATAGMHIVLKAMDIGDGDEVITPSMTFASTVNQIVLAGARPVFVDCDYDTLMPQASVYAKAITKRTKAIIPVHFAGAPADLDAIEDAAGTIPVIEDAAHAIDTRYKGRHIGGKNTAIFSFHPIKNITTGEGGMVTGNDEALMRRLRLLKFHGIERDAWKRYGKGSDPSYDIIEPGFKYNMTDIQAALGLVQMKKIAAITRRRSEIAGAYLEGLKGIGLDLPGVPAYEHQHSWHLFVVKVRALERPEFMAALAEANIGYGMHFPACHTLSYIKKLYGAATLPVTEEVAGRIISLPIHPGMDDDQVNRVIAVVRGVLA